MLILASNTDKLRLITGSAGNIHVHASWMDNVAGAIAPGRTNTPAIIGATTTDIVGSPAAGVFRNIKTLLIHNNGVANNAVTVVHTDGTTATELHQASIAPGETLQYIDEIGFGGLLSSVFTTGDAKLTLKTLPDAGWVMMNDGTIGDATSGAVTRASADCESLFALLYNNVNDTNAPVLTSTGAATTRAAQGTAAAAWAAHCRMTLTRQLGRSLAVAGGGAGLTARALGGFDGSETHTMTAAELRQHGHTINGSYGYLYTDGSTHNVVEGGGLTVYSTSGYQTATDQAGSSIPMDILNPRAYWNVMIKL